MINREAIFSALFALVGSIAGIKTKSRRMKHWDDVNAPDCPALFMAQKGQNARRQTRQPPIWEFDVDLVVYVKTDGNHAAVPSTALNNVLDSIENVFTSSNLTDPRQTLGGLVYDCRIEGAIETDEGALGETAVAIVPVRIYVPA